MVQRCPDWQPTWPLTCASLSIQVRRWWSSGKDKVAIFKNLIDCTFPAGSDGGMERQRGIAIMCSDNV